MTGRKKYIVGKAGSKRKLHEAISYTPEKIDAFVQKATKDVQDTKLIYNSIRSKAMDLSLGDAMQTPEKVQELLDKCTQALNYLKKAHSTYFDVVDLYDIFDQPVNVKQLEKLVNELDYYIMDMEYLKDAIDSILEAAKYLNRATNKEDN